MPINNALAELSTLISQLIDERRTSRSALEGRTGWKRQTISAVAAGRTIPSAGLAEALDAALAAGGRITTLRVAAKREQNARRLLPDPTATVATEEDPTDRRQFTSLAALSVVAMTTRARIETAISDSRLEDLEGDAVDIATAYGTTPYAETLAAVAGRWHELEQIVDGRIAPHARRRVMTLAGQFTFFLSRLAFNNGDLRAAGRFAGLASSYADEAGDPVLTLSLATIYSGIRYWRQDYPGALDELHKVGHINHPYMDARIAAYQARTYARLGRADETRTALDRMEATVCTAPPRPGETPVGPAAAAMFRTGLARRIGDVAMALEWGPVAVAAYQHGGPDYTVEEHQHAALDHAMALYADRRDGGPEAAALAALAALRLQPTPTHTIVTKAGELARSFTADHRRLTEVATFTETMRALPAGGTS